MTTEVKLSPGWLLRDVRIAAERLDPSQRESSPNPGREEPIVAREGDEPKRAPGIQMTVAIEELGRLIVRKRGSRGIRAAAEEVGISSATLSRVSKATGTTAAQGPDGVTSRLPRTAMAVNFRLRSRRKS